MGIKERKKVIKILSVFIIIIIFSIFLFLLIYPSKNNCFDKKTNKLNCPEHRSPPKFTMNLLNETNNYSTYKIIYYSKPFLDQESKIYGLLYVPKNEGMISKELIPGIVFLPGGGVKKEEEPAGLALLSLGYAVLVIDQRGIGETGGFYPNYDQDRALFESKDESIQLLGVYDSLRAIDVLKELDFIDKKNINIGGSSMGGRYAIIAAGVDYNINKAIIISSAGFHMQTQNNVPKYYLAIDPDEYIKDISPRKLIMIHSTNDTTISINDAKFTFSLANEPKIFYSIEECNHGYCDKMFPILAAELTSK
ncbi:MAG: acetylxylan esterase [Candidatus Woesearchaeota archaeon]